MITLAYLTRVQCSCKGPLHGLNIGELISTFSLWVITATRHKPAKRPVSCTGANANKWAFCLDAPCSADKGGVSCKCLLNAASDYTIFSSSCPTDDKALHTARAETWSSASQAELKSGYSQLIPFYGNPPNLAYCPPSQSGSPAVKDEN